MKGYKQMLSKKIYIKERRMGCQNKGRILKGSTGMEERKTQAQCKGTKSPNDKIIKLSDFLCGNRGLGILEISTR